MVTCEPSESASSYIRSSLNIFLVPIFCCYTFQLVDEWCLVFDVWCSSAIVYSKCTGLRLHDMNETDIIIVVLFYFFFIVEKHFVPSFVSWMFHSRICHHRWNMHTHTAEDRFSRGKCFTYLRFFLSIKDRLFALSSGRKKKKRSIVESLTFRFFMVVFELRCLFATHVCTLYNGYLCFV